VARVALGNAHSAPAQWRSYSLQWLERRQRFSSELALGRDVLVVDKMRHALAAILAVPALWVSTVAFPITGLVYCLAIVALDGIEHIGRRLKVAPRRRDDR